LLGECNDLIVIPIDECHFYCFDLDHIKDFVHLHYFCNFLVDFCLGFLSVVDHVADFALVVEVVFDLFASGRLDSVEGGFQDTLGIGVVAATGADVRIFCLCDDLGN
jgi:hypothetical protein